jgi:hypothetical protein
MELSGFDRIPALATFAEDRRSTERDDRIWAKHPCEYIGLSN